MPTARKPLVFSGTGGLGEMPSGDFLPITAGGTGAATVAGALGSLGLNTLGPPAVNGLDNAEMRVAQRGTSFANAGNAGSAPQMTLDRWFAYRGGYAANLSASQVAGPAGYANAMRVQRAQGDTALNRVFFGQVIETADCGRYAGRTVTLSFTLTAGTTYSGGAVTVQANTGTGADEGRVAMAGGAWTGQVTASGAVTPTTTPTRYSVSLAVPAGATEIGLVWSWVPTGTAGAADSLDMTGVQIEEGAQAGPFERVPMALDLARCRRQLRYAEPGIGTWYAGGSSAGAQLQFTYLDMRGGNPTLTLAQPALTIADPGVVNVQFSAAALNLNTTTPTMATVNITAGSGTQTGSPTQFHIALLATASAILVSKEL